MGVLRLSLLLCVTAALCTAHFLPAPGGDFLSDGVNDIFEGVGEKVGDIIDNFKDKADDVVDNIQDAVDSVDVDVDNDDDVEDDLNDEDEDNLNEDSDEVTDDVNEENDDDSDKDTNEDNDEDYDDDNDEDNDEDAQDDVGEDSDEDVDDDLDEDNDEDIIEDVDEVIDDVHTSDLVPEELEVILDDMDNEIIYELDLAEMKSRIKERRMVGYRKKRWVPLAIGAARIAFGAARHVFRGAARAGKHTWQKTKKGDRLRTQQYNRPGNYQDARRDFERFKVTERKDFGIGSRGMVGKHEVKVRSTSSSGRPTLEIRTPRGDGTTHLRKFRYMN